MMNKEHVRQDGQVSLLDLSRFLFFFMYRPLAFHKQAPGGPKNVLSGTPI